METPDFAELRARLTKPLAFATLCGVCGVTVLAPKNCDTHECHPHAQHVRDMDTTVFADSTSGTLTTVISLGGPWSFGTATTSST